MSSELEFYEACGRKQKKMPHPKYKFTIPIQNRQYNYPINILSKNLIFEISPVQPTEGRRRMTYPIFFIPNGQVQR